MNEKSPGRPTHVLGISAYYHDSAACILRDGEIVAAAQEERFTRKKHDPSFPSHAVGFCLKTAGIDITAVDHVAFYEKPFVKFDRLLHSYLACAPRGLKSFLKSMQVWLRDKIWMKAAIARELRYSGPILFVEHHEAHAASAFFASPFDEAAFLTVDGVGEWATTSFGVGRGNRIEPAAEMHFPHSLGLLYSAFTHYAGFRVNSGEYKLMGLAPYGDPRFVGVILDKLVDLKDDGSFRLNMKYFDYVVGLQMTNRHFENLFGAPRRKPESELTQHYMDVARSIQDVTEEIMVRMARRVHRQTGLKNLCLAGGVALNCVANARVLRETGIEKIWIQPAAGDAGGALGAALVIWHHYLNQPRNADNHRDLMKGAYLGPQFTRAEIQQLLSERGIPYTELNISDLPEKIADLIAQEKVIGWFQGRMEFGPRALGARSIIADARSPKMQEVMNLKIKFRESFRPFAPSVLREKAQDYFDLDQDSPYMLLTAPITKSKRLNPPENFSGLAKLQSAHSIIPAVTHVDYSARVQTVTEDFQPLYYRTIKALDEKYGCPVIINTSFNVRGEPIVCTPEDACNCFDMTNMDYLLLENFLIEKKNQKPLDKDSAWLKKFDLD